MVKQRMEYEIMQECFDFLNGKQIYTWRNNPGKYGLKGSSDILGITKDGRLLAIECKREVGGYATAEQKEFLKNVEDKGGVALVVRSVNELNEKLSEAGVI